MLGGSRRLASAGIASANQDAAALAAHALGSEGEADLTPTRDQLAAFASLVEQRCARVPIERLTGWVRFRQLDLLVGEGLFLPQPETSCVVGWVADAARRLIASGRENPVCVDLCCGAGTIALSVASEVPQAIVHGVEVDPGAHAWAARNAHRLALDVHLHGMDSAEALDELNGSVDIVTSNPPYVATGELASVSPEVRDHDPAITLAGGDDGLDVIRIVERTARRLLRPGGTLAVEHSDRQGQAALNLFHRSTYWTNLAAHQDHERLDRFITATRLRARVRSVAGRELLGVDHYIRAGPGIKDLGEA
ncbi:MAG TPA: peptide chain release factor N(5)-glutamine methyltransferase [Frankiaceae bacterium]|nr:peptide chain release factor N(5)-glutamine methyltransferase [Frankiaceae bacterium]